MAFTPFPLLCSILSCSLSLCWKLRPTPRPQRMQRSGRVPCQPSPVRQLGSVRGQRSTSNTVGHYHTRTPSSSLFLPSPSVPVSPFPLSLCVSLSLPCFNPEGSGTFLHWLQALDSDVANNQDVKEVFKDVTASMQCAMVESATNREWMRLVGRDHDVYWWTTKVVLNLCGMHHKIRSCRINGPFNAVCGAEEGGHSCRRALQTRCPFSFDFIGLLSEGCHKCPCAAQI